MTSPSPHPQQDIRPQWYNVVRRLQSVAHGNIGLAELSINVLVDADGNPVVWSKPRQRVFWRAIAGQDQQAEVQRGLPDDIRPRWFTVLRSFQSAALDVSRGMSVMQVALLVDARGNPVIWSEPQWTLVEPKRMTDEFLALLTGNGIGP